MTVWLWDRIVPVIAIITTYRLGCRQGRMSERIDWLTGRRTAEETADA